MKRLFDHLLDGKPYVYLSLRDGLLEATMYGQFAAAKPEDEIVYIESPAFRAHRERLAKPVR